MVLGLACLAVSIPLTFAKASATSTTTREVEGSDAKPQAFLSELGAALRIGDVAFLQSHLHPAVIQLFGSRACTAHLAALKDPTANFAVQSVGPPSTYHFGVKGQTQPIPNTIPVATAFTQQGRTTNITVHLARLPSGALTWFTAC